MRIVVALSAIAIAPLAFAQDDAALRAAADTFTAAQAGAAGSATRAGDESLTCEQSYAEFATLAQNPGFEGLAQQQTAVMTGGLAGFAAAGQPGAAPVAAAAAEAVPAEEGRRRGGGGFLKKIGGAAGALGGLGGLGGRGGGAVAAAGAVSGAAGVLGGGGGDLANVAAATQAAGALGALGGGGGGDLAGLAAAGALSGLGGGRGADGAVAAAAAAGALQGQAGGDLGGVAAAGLAQQQLALGQQAGIGQLTALTAMSPELMRGARLLELAEGQNCAWTKNGGAPPAQR